ncbi:hypothetical protein Pcinc_038474 [Petrolisthes cinctipes]|nr:hypothetical protein Pcinc_038474 [Petrolisthes cinctipes]
MSLSKLCSEDSVRLPQAGSKSSAASNSITERKRVEEDKFESLEDALKKSELGSKVQEEKSHLTFQLAHPTDDYNKLENKLDDSSNEVLQNQCNS